MDATQLLTLGIIWYVVFLLSTVLHEAAHAYVAKALGDSTAYEGGQVTLDPVPHIQREPIGTVVVPALSFLANQGGWMIGWASCPYDPYWAMRYPRRAAAMALAGPASNFTLVIVAALLIRLGIGMGYFEMPARMTVSEVTAAKVHGLAHGIAIALSILFSLNLVLCILNLIPLPPLDGSAVIQLFMPSSSAAQLQETLNQPMFGLVGLVIAWQLFPYLFRPVFGFALDLLYAPELGGIMKIVT